MFPKRLLTILLALMAAGAPAAGAQVPGTPVLQNAFGNPGLAFAANVGAGGGQSFFGAAGAWGLGGGGSGSGSSRLQVSGAAGAQRANDATRGAYGARLASTLWTSSGGALGIGAFVGFGGAARTRSADTISNAAVMIVPAGASLGYRGAFGSRGVSAYLSPLYRWTRAESDSVSTSGSFGVAVGIDFAATNAIGVTLGTELGAGGKSGSGSGGSRVGFAVSFVPGRR